MGCANTSCKCRNWCKVKTEIKRDPIICPEAKIISQWWRDKVSGLRDPEPEEIPFSDDDFTEDEMFEDDTI